MIRRIINESYNDSLEFVNELADFAVYHIMWSGDKSKDVDLGNLLDNLKLNCPQNLLIKRASVDLKNMVNVNTEIPTEDDFLYRITNLNNNEIEMQIIYKGEIQGDVVFYLNNFKIRMKYIN